MKKLLLISIFTMSCNIVTPEINNSDQQPLHEPVGDNTLKLNQFNGLFFTSAKTENLNLQFSNMTKSDSNTGLTDSDLETDFQTVITMANEELVKSLSLETDKFTGMFAIPKSSPDVEIESGKSIFSIMLPRGSEKTWYDRLTKPDPNTPFDRLLEIQNQRLSDDKIHQNLKKYLISNSPKIGLAVAGVLKITTTLVILYLDGRGENSSLSKRLTELEQKSDSGEAGSINFLETTNVQLLGPYDQESQHYPIVGTADLKGSLKTLVYKTK